MLTAALVTWVVTVQRMRGMDAGPGTDLGTLGWFVGIWLTMMAAMMFPSALPMVLMFDRISQSRESRWGRFRVDVALRGRLPRDLAALRARRLRRLPRDRRPACPLARVASVGAHVAGTLVALAGVYELTPIKTICLRHCRSPLHFVMSGWKRGRVGAVRMGLTHGSYCVGCCWGLMLLLFALGVMSLFWMALVAALIFAQKLLPFGERLPYVFAVGFIALGIWVAAAPGSVPKLTQPGSQMPMQTTPMKP